MQLAGLGTLLGVFGAVLGLFAIVGVIVRSIVLKNRR